MTGFVGTRVSGRRVYPVLVSVGLESGTVRRYFGRICTDVAHVDKPRELDGGELAQMLQTFRDNPQAALSEYAGNPTAPLSAA